MILNGWAVVDLFIASVRIGLALVVLANVRAEWRRRNQASVAGEQADERGAISAVDASERRRALAVLSAWALVTLSVVSWPLFYAVLQSYVPHWPGVMCIYGVTRVGESSQGLSRALPWLVSGVEWAKPLTVFLSGAWGAMYLVDRRLPQSRYRRGVAAALGLFASVALIDACLEGSYLLIPKREHGLNVGCCVGALSELGRAGRFLPSSLAFAAGDRNLGLLTIGITAALSVSLAWLLVLGTDRAVARGLPLLVLMAAGTLPLGLLFLRQILAPRILGLPYHYCAYDLWSQVPESLVGVALYGLGAFGVGWAGLSAVVERGGGTASRVDEQRGRSGASGSAAGRELTRRWLFLGLTGYVAGSALLGVEWWLSGDRDSSSRCALDGRPLDRRSRDDARHDDIRFTVRLHFADAASVELCSLRCAELWLLASGRRPTSVQVVDEAGGGVIDANEAYYVRSRVVSHPPTGDRRHVFRREADARSHAAAFAGRVLEGDQRPFADPLGRKRFDEE